MSFSPPTTTSTRTHTRMHTHDTQMHKAYMLPKPKSNDSVLTVHDFCHCVAYQYFLPSA